MVVHSQIVTENVVYPVEEQLIGIVSTLPPSFQNETLSTASPALRSRTARFVETQFSDLPTLQLKISIKIRHRLSQEVICVT